MSGARDLPASVNTCIVVPCFNEASRLLPEAFLSFAASGRGIEFLFVDDGSTDATGRLLSEMCARNPTRLTMLTLRSNQGKAEAVRRGFLAALAKNRTHYVGFWDADLATPLEEIDAMRGVLERRPSVDIVIGIRLPLLGHRIRRSPFRTLLGHFFARAVSLRWGRRFRDTQCGAKLFRDTPGVRAAVAERFRSTWIFDVELLARCRFVDGGRDDEVAGIYEHPVETWTDRGHSKVRARSYVRALLDFPLVWNRRYHPIARDVPDGAEGGTAVDTDGDERRQTPSPHHDPARMT